MKYIAAILLAAVLLQLSSCTINSILREKLFQDKHIRHNGDIPTQCNKLNLADQPQAYAYSGFLKAVSDSSNSVFGFTLYGSQKSQGDPAQFKNYPTILWLQGGPGYSAQFGNLVEFGPYLPMNTTQEGVKWVYNKYSPNIDYNLLFIDTPIGVGMSYIEKPDDAPSDQMTFAAQLYNGLQKLYYNDNGCFKVLDMANTPLFIFGETYGTKYALSLADYILMKGDQNIKLKGIALGDSFFSPNLIISQIGVSAFNLGLVDLQERSVLEEYIMQTQWDIRFQDWDTAYQDYLQIYSNLQQMSGLPNILNFRQVTDMSLIDLDVLFSDPDMKSMYGMLKDYPYQYFNSTTMQIWSTDHLQDDCETKLEKLLSRGLPVMVYQGQNDALICPLCQEYQLDNVNYAQKTSFYNSVFQPWYQDGSTSMVYGYTKSAGNLEYWTVNRAGSFVPHDQPQAAYQMFKKFIAKNI